MPKRIRKNFLKSRANVEQHHERAVAGDEALSETQRICGILFGHGFMLPKEAARILHVTASRVGELALAGKVEAIRIGTERLYVTETVLRLNKLREAALLRALEQEAAAPLEPSIDIPETSRGAMLLGTGPPGRVLRTPPKTTTRILG